jgi:hypothetical protein
VIKGISNPVCFHAVQGAKASITTALVSVLALGTVTMNKSVSLYCHSALVVKESTDTNAVAVHSLAPWALRQ